MNLMPSLILVPIFYNGLYGGHFTVKIIDVVLAETLYDLDLIFQPCHIVSWTHLLASQLHHERRGATAK